MSENKKRNLLRRGVREPLKAQFSPSFKIKSPSVKPRGGRERGSPSSPTGFNPQTSAQVGDGEE